MLFLEYPKCSTCVKAKKWLDENHINYEDRHIVQNNPTKTELTEWINNSGYQIQKFFNTSGMKYKELNLKEKLKGMSDGEKIELLSSDGMLVKRPLIIGEGKVLVGFKEDEWNAYFGKEKSE